MGDRALAHIEKILKVYPIKDADNIEMVQLLDFHVVVKKNEFKVGDLALYVEVDSILPNTLPADLEPQYEALKSQLKVFNKQLKKTPEDAPTKESIKTTEEEIQKILSQNKYPEFEFLRQKKFTIRALKYNKFLDDFGNPIVSMGIVFPISVLHSVAKTNEKIVSEISLGMDVTEILGIEKVVEDPEETMKNVSEKIEKGAIETFLDKRFFRYKFYRTLKKKIVGEKIVGSWLDIFPPRSDAENIQKIFSRIKEKYSDVEFYRNSKIEGQNYSAYTLQTKTFFNLFEKSSFGVCTRNRNLITDDGSRFWKTAKELDLQKRLKSIGKNILCRGEHTGPNIQGNIYKLPEHHLYLFEVWDLEKQQFYNFDQFMEFCHKYEFEHVPVLNESIKLLDTVQEMLNLSNHYDELVPGVKVLSEGDVWRTKDMKVSFKVKNPEYLILHGK